MMGRRVTARLLESHGFFAVSGIPFCVNVRTYMRDRIWTPRVAMVLMRGLVAREVVS